MRVRDQRATHEKTIGRSRSVAFLALAAILSLWTLGTLHVAEHDVRHDTTSCGTCIAVAADGLVDSAPLALDTQPDTGTELVSAHEEPAPTGRVLRLSARAPPTRRA